MTTLPHRATPAGDLTACDTRVPSLLGLYRKTLTNKKSMDCSDGPLRHWGMIPLGVRVTMVDSRGRRHGRNIGPTHTAE